MTKRLTKEEFVSRYVDSSHIDIDTFHENFFVLPCDCEERGCLGWQVVSKVGPPIESTSPKPSLREAQSVTCDMVTTSTCYDNRELRKPLRNPLIFIIYKTPKQIVGVIVAENEHLARVAAQGKWNIVHDVEQVNMDQVTLGVQHIISIDYDPIDGKPKSVRRGW